MAALDSNIVTIALPKISSELSAGFSLLAWVITGYLLALAALTLQTGKMGDVYGRKRIYLAGFIIFGFSSALCGLSQNIYELIAFRVVQGASAAMLFSVSRPILLATFPPNEVSFAFGVNSASYSIGAVIGPVIGGFLVAADWRLIFYVNVPIAALATLIAIRKVPSGTNDVSIRTGLGAINPLNASLLAIVVAAILLWLSFLDLRYGLVGFVLLLPLLISERRSRHPLINRELRANRGFVYAIFAICALGVGFNGIVVAMSFYFQSVISLSSEVSGVLIAPLSLGLAVASVLAGRMYGRMKKPLILAFVGALITGVGLLAVAYLVELGAAASIIAAALLVVGCAVGLYWTPMLTAALKLSRLDLMGAANGTFSMFVTIGGAVSVAVTVAISAFFLPQTLASQVYSGGLTNLTVAQATPFKQGIQDALIALGLVEFVSIPLILLVIKNQKRPTGGERLVVS